MKRTTLIECAVFTVIGAAGVLEALRLGKQHNDLYQMMGPGMYILGLGLVLLVAAVVHLRLSGRGTDRPRDDGVSAAMRRRTFGLVALLCVNNVLIDVLGYAAASVVFFLGAYWLSGVRSWVQNLMLSLVSTAVFYAVFVQLCSVIFPEGLLF